MVCFEWANLFGFSCQWPNILLSDKHFFRFWISKIRCSIFDEPISSVFLSPKIQWLACHEPLFCLVSMSQSVHFFLSRSNVLLAMNLSFFIFFLFSSFSEPICPMFLLAMAWRFNKPMISLSLYLQRAAVLLSMNVYFHCFYFL